MPTTSPPPASVMIDLDGNVQIGLGPHAPVTLTPDEALQLAVWLIDTARVAKPFEG